MNAKTPRPTRPDWYRLAARALHEAGRRDVEAAAVTVQEIASTCGPECLPDVMLAWIDTTLTAVGVRQEGEPVVLVFKDIDTGETTANSNEVRPATAWAGRLLNARAADDQPGFQALLDAAQVDERTWFTHVMHLLFCCALTAGQALTKGASA